MKTKITLAALSFIAFIGISALIQNGYSVDSAYVLPRMNVLYKGIDNPIEIHGFSENDSLACDNITIKKGKKVGSFLLHPNRPTGRKGNEFHVMRDDKIISGFRLRVKRLPDPSAHLMNQKGGLMTVKKLQAAKHLQVRMENFDFEVTPKIHSYTLRITLGGDVIELKTNGSEISKKAKIFLSKLKKGSLVTFHNIKAELPDGSIRLIAPILLKVR